LLFLAGGSPKADAANPFASSELYGFATVTTDLADYHPGMTVTINGAGWVPGETVSLTLVENTTGDIHELEPVTADGSGRIVSTEFAPDEGDIGIRFFLTATGSQSQAQTSFTDAPADTMTVSPTSVQAGVGAQTLTFSFTSGTDYTKSPFGQASVVVPAGWSSPSSNTTVPLTSECTSVSQSGISGSGPWTILINQNCDKGDKGSPNQFTFTYNNVTPPSAGGVATFTSQSGPTGALTAITTSPTVTVTTDTKLAITSVNSGANPTAGTAFSVVVQAQDASNAAANVAAATGVSLSLITGTGTLGGTLSGTIAAGSNSVTITGVTYTKAESGVVIRAT